MKRKIYTFKLIKHYFKRFIKKPLKQKFMIIEVFFLLGFTRFMILFIPFRKIASLMGKVMKESPEVISPDLLVTAKQITRYIQKISNFTPWQSKCFVQALSAQFMLKNRGIPSTIYFGVAKDVKQQLLAHAWLRCGPEILTGSVEQPGFTPVVFFCSKNVKKE